MGIAPILNAAKYIPSSMVLQGLAKINPKFKNFFTEAATYGYDATKALDYLSSKFSSSGEEQFKRQLEEGAQQNTLRPDEASSLSQIRGQEMPGKILRGALGYGGAAISGLQGSSSSQDQSQGQQQQNQEQQQEEEYNPLAIGAISGNAGSKPSPMSQSINDQIRSAPQTGRSPSAMSKNINDEIRSAKPQQRSYDPLAGLQKYPELLQFIQEEQSKGGNAHSITSKARKSAKLGTFINVIEQEVGEAFENVLARLMGTQSQQGQKPQGNSTPAMDEFISYLGQFEKLRSGRNRG